MLSQLPIPSRDTVNSGARACCDSIKQRVGRCCKCPFYHSLTIRQKCSVVCIAIANFMMEMSVGFMPILFPALIEERKLTTTESGYVFGAHSVAVMIGSVVCGRLVHKVTSRKLFLVGMTIQGVGNILFGFVTLIPSRWIFYTFALFIRVLDGFGHGILSTATFTVNINDFKENFGAAYGILEIFSGVAMITSPEIGELLSNAGSFGAPFWVLGIFTLICFIPVTWHLLPMDPPEKEYLTPGPYRKMMMVPGVLITCFAIFALSTMWGFLDPTLEPYVRRFKVQPGALGLVFVIMPLAYTAFAPFWGWYSDTIRNQRVLMVVGLIFSFFGMLYIGPSPLMFFFSPHVAITCVSLFVIGLGTSLGLIPSFQVLLNFAILNGLDDVVGTYGIIAGIWGSTYHFGKFVGPIIGGLLTDTLSFQWATTIYSGFIILVTFCVLMHNIFSDNQSVTDDDNWKETESMSSNKRPNVIKPPKLALTLS